MCNIYLLTVSTEFGQDPVTNLDKIAEKNPKHELRVRTRIEGLLDVVICSSKSIGV